MMRREKRKIDAKARERASFYIQVGCGMSSGMDRYLPVQDSPGECSAQIRFAACSVHRSCLPSYLLLCVHIHEQTCLPNLAVHTPPFLPFSSTYLPGGRAIHCVMRQYHLVAGTGVSVDYIMTTATNHLFTCSLAAHLCYIKNLFMTTRCSVTGHDAVCFLSHWFAAWGPINNAHCFSAVHGLRLGGLELFLCCFVYCWRWCSFIVHLSESHIVTHAPYCFSVCLHCSLPMAVSGLHCSPCSEHRNNATYTTVAPTH